MDVKATPELPDWDEILEYPPGATVELKARPGVSDVIDYYDPVMVPPIWLVNDPRPRYPHELRVMSIPAAITCEIPCPAPKPLARQLAPVG
uniref:hypothetical protein n=1 Tax=Petrachloros mirabilis TaxID=2918835 RepID=UPI001EE8B137|nr:hypothetical protein [Petrachloros mirabilis]